MAQLMITPIRDKGDAVMIVTVRADLVLMGYVATSTLARFFREPPSSCECLGFVRKRLEYFEQVLFRKSLSEYCIEQPGACVEIEAVDLPSAVLQGSASIS